MANTIAYAEMVHCDEMTFSTYKPAYNAIESQMISAEYERCMPSSAAMLPNFARCVYRYCQNWLHYH